MPPRAASSVAAGADAEAVASTLKTHENRLLILKEDIQWKGEYVYLVIDEEAGRCCGKRFARSG